MSEEDFTSIPDYLSEVEFDPEPGSDTSNEWSALGEADYVISEEGRRVIEENLNVYLSAIGMTVEMIDPYCGPILAENLPEIVKRWAVVIGHYPRLAQLFLSEESGMLMSWVAALRATWPVLNAVYEHHLAGTIRVIDGTIVRVVKGEAPPTGEPEYTVE